MDQARITVVIPTRERCDTLMWTLRNVLSFDDPGLSVLVCDNDSHDGTEDVILQCRDERLHYIKTPTRLGMTENWDYALGHVGETDLVTIIGDDDALIPSSLQYVREIFQETSCKALRANGCAYAWPGVQGNPEGSLSLQIQEGTKTLSSNHVVDQVLRGKCDYRVLPLLYNGGYVRADVLKEIKDKRGKYVQGLSPDVCLGFSIAAVCGEYVFSLRPLAINGASHHSNGTAAFSAGPADPVLQKFWREATAVFHKDFPLEKSGMPPASMSVSVHEAYRQMISWSGEQLASDRYEDLLKQCLADTGETMSVTHDWCRRFATMHGLDYNRIKNTGPSPFTRIRSAVSRFARAREKMTTFYRAPTKRNGVANVHDAADLVGRLQKFPPTKAEVVLSNVNYLFRERGD